MSGTRVMNEFFSRMHYGGVAGPGTLEHMERFGKALLAIVGADGISDNEWNTFAELGRHLGVPDEVVQGMRAHHLGPADLDEILAGLKDSGLARGMLYNAIVISHADGYSDAERAATRRAAALLDIDVSVVLTIEALVEADIALRRARAQVLLVGAS